MIPSNLQLNNTNWLQYNVSAPREQAVIPVSDPTKFDPFDDMTLIPYDHEPLLQNPDHSITVNVNFQILDNGIDYAFLGNITYTKPQVPTLYTVYSAGDLAANEAIYGEFTHPVVLQHNEVVEIVLNNQDTGTHPFHLHGHNFQMVDRFPSYGAHFYDYKTGTPVAYDAANHTAFPESPPRRDTFVVAPGGYWVARFRADNPGVWFFHCHIDWHLSQGLGMVMIEAPDILQTQRDSVPQQHFDTCKAAGIAYEGNAAGNVEDLLNLKGEMQQKGWLPSGFTARGIVALVFSCVSAVLGMAMIAVYGFLEPVARKHTVRQGVEFTAAMEDSSRGDSTVKGGEVIREGQSMEEMEGHEIRG